MTRAPRLLASIAVALLATVVPAAPAAGSANDVIRDCSEDGVLNGHYSHKELAKALDKLPSDLDEYTDCRAVIREAELASAKKNKRPGVAGNVDTSSPPTPDEQRKIEEAAKSAEPVEIGGKKVTPGFRAAGVGGKLPTLVVLMMLGLLVGMLAGAALAIQRHPAFASIAARMPAPVRRLGQTLRDGIARFRR